MPCEAPASRPSGRTVISSASPASSRHRREAPSMRRNFEYPHRWNQSIAKRAARSGACCAIHRARSPATASEMQNAPSLSATTSSHLAKFSATPGPKYWGRKIHSRSYTTNDLHACAGASGRTPAAHLNPAGMLQPFLDKTPHHPLDATFRIVLSEPEISTSSCRFALRGTTFRPWPPRPAATGCSVNASGVSIRRRRQVGHAAIRVDDDGRNSCNPAQCRTFRLWTGFATAHRRRQPRDTGGKSKYPPSP